MLGTLGIALIAASVPCGSLRAQETPQAAIAAVEVVPAGRFVPPGGSAAPAAEPIPEHCRVKLVLKPTADSHINSELWMPTSNWNGKLLVVGNGGFAGSIQGYGDMQAALRIGYATAATDTGHSAADGPGGMFGLGHPEKIVDFAYRAVHETTVTAKTLIRAYYERAPEYSYFKGCSTGGRQAVMAAQRYPEDYDGIIAGALANRHIQMHTAGFARRVMLARNPGLAIPEAKATLVNDALMRQCDTLKEGFLNNPRQCTFDFSTLQCQAGEGGNCLTKAQLEMVETFYGGVRNSAGELIFSGQALGNPLPALPSTTDFTVTDTVRIWGFQNPDYDWRTFDLDRDMPIVNGKVGFVDAVEPDLSAFKARGGKLLLYAGWGDTTITPENTVLYYESVLEEMGPDQDTWVRLFMVPGMGHCRGGDGPWSFDSIGALEQWRERGAAPQQIRGANPQSGLARPICPYPQYARYHGSGDIKRPESWSCAAP